MTMEPKNAAEGPARVEEYEDGEWGTLYAIHFLGVVIHLSDESERAEADELCSEINRALSPLVAKAEMAERMAEALKDARGLMNTFLPGVKQEVLESWDKALSEYAAIGGK